MQMVHKKVFLTFPWGLVHLDKLSARRRMDVRGANRLLSLKSGQFRDE